MATKTFTEVYDDMDGRTKAKETVTFGLDDNVYEIDLNDKNVTRLRDALKPFVEHARKATPSKPVAIASDAAEVRAWAAQNGIDVPARGRIPSDVRKSYEESKQRQTSKSKGK